MKEVYLNCQSEIQSKIVFDIPSSQPHALTPVNSKPMASPPQQHHSNHNDQNGSKKASQGHQKRDDEDFNEEDVEDEDDDVEYDIESS